MPISETLLWGAPLPRGSGRQTLQQLSQLQTCIDCSAQGTAMRSEARCPCWACEALSTVCTEKSGLTGLPGTLLSSRESQQPLPSSLQDAGPLRGGFHFCFQNPAVPHKMNPSLYPRADLEVGCWAVIVPPCVCHLVPGGPPGIDTVYTFKLYKCFSSNTGIGAERCSVGKRLTSQS